MDVSEDNGQTLRDSKPWGLDIACEEYICTLGPSVLFDKCVQECKCASVQVCSAQKWFAHLPSPETIGFSDHTPLVAHCTQLASLVCSTCFPCAHIDPCPFLSLPPRTPASPFPSLIPGFISLCIDQVYPYSLSSSASVPFLSFLFSSHSLSLLRLHSCLSSHFDQQALYLVSSPPVVVRNTLPDLKDLITTNQRVNLSLRDLLRGVSFP